MITYFFRIPKPPSVNNMHGIIVRDGRKYLKKTTIEWYKVAGEEISMQIRNRETLLGPVKVDIILYTRENDLDNVRKCIYDLIKFPTITQPYGMGLIRDDDQIMKDAGAKVMVKKKEEERVFVTIHSLQGKTEA